MDKGAHYHSIDIQVHSPLDDKWKGKGAASEEERKEYARSLVAACRQKSLQAIAITDHHEIGFVSLVRAAAANERDNEGALLSPEKRLIVFPGMELTLGVPCQAILLFDAEFPEDMFALATTALAIQKRDSGVVRLDHITSLQQLANELDKHAYLRGRYIVFPNVSDGGTASLLRSGMAGKYIEMPCVGGYVDGAFDRLGSGNQNILLGKESQWGNKRVAVIQSSDNRSAAHDLLGKHRTWIKWAVPTAEALRQACLAQESRIELQEPQLPSVFVESISVSNSSFLGPISLELNRQFNALIGGRGTGKSTILEYLRWGLCDQPLGLIDDSEVPNYQRRRTRLVDSTLKPVSGKVEVRLSLNGTTHIVRHDSNSGKLELKIGEQQFEPCTEEQVQSLLPIQAYSQKQLSDVSIRIDELIRFITTPIKHQIDSVDERIAEEQQVVREKYSGRERKLHLQVALAKAQLVQQSFDQRAAELRKRLKGLSDTDRKLIADAPVVASSDRAINARVIALSNAFEAIKQSNRTLARQFSSVPPLPEGIEPDLLKSIGENFGDATSKALAKITEAHEVIDTGITVFQGAGGLLENWKQQQADFNKNYNEAAARSSAQSNTVKELNEIEAQLAENVAEVDRLQSEIASLVVVDTEYERARGVINQLQDGRSNLLENRTNALTEQSNGLIRVRLKRSVGVREFLEVLREILKGSGIRANKFDVLETNLRANDDPGVVLRSLLYELEQIAVHHDIGKGDVDLPVTPVLLQNGFNAGDVARMCRTVTQSEWLRLSLVHVGDEPIFEYRTKEGEYIQFSNASAGQQATALLSTLLNIEGPPLVVDQPEEDLDNSVIQDIVEQIWNAKHKRQIIFASHSANIVVNGDADFVLCCRYRSAGDQSMGKIAEEGAIDVADVREAIEEIMEGGEAAFNLRRKKYGF